MQHDDHFEDVCFMASSIEIDHDSHIDLCGELGKGRVKTMPSKTRKELEKNVKEIRKEDTQLRSTLTKNKLCSWFATMICLLPFMMSWFDTSSSAVEGIQ